MAKRKALEERLDSPFRWPQRGDTPFVAADDPYDNANIPDGKLDRLVLMMEGYKKAADLMVDATTNDIYARATLVFPIIFNYRQFIELELKYHLAMYGPAVAIDPNWDTHDLARLWEWFLDMLEGYGTPDPDEADPVVGEIILEFAKIDPNSYSYRYPVDRKGNPLPVAYRDLYLPALADVMNAIAGYFAGCDGYLSELPDAASE